jgi:plastocyanin
MNKQSRRRRGRRVAAIVASCGTALVLGPAAGSAAAADCGVAAMAQPLVDHIDSAHLETSPLQQVKDLMNVDAYVLAHTVLLEHVLAPLVPTVEGTVTPFVDHVNSAHLERSPLQQVRDLLDVDDYVLAHTVLVEHMLEPALSGTGCPTDGAPGMPVAPGSAAPAPTMPSMPSMPAAPAPPSPPAGPATGAAVTMDHLAFAPAAVTVPAGSTVTWTNREDAPHTVTSQGGGGLRSKTLQKGATYSVAFSTAGVYSYYCTVHPNMKGTVTVQ